MNLHTEVQAIITSVENFLETKVEGNTRDGLKEVVEGRVLQAYLDGVRDGASKERRLLLSMGVSARAN